jgi:hypothetical protein
VSTFDIVAALKHLDEDIKMYFPPAQAERAIAVHMRAANALIEADALTVRLDAALEWGDEIGQMCAAAAQRATRNESA